MIDRNYIYQGGAMLIPFLLSPFIYSVYGAEEFGFYSLVITWGMFSSYLITLRMEVLISSSKNRKESCYYSSTAFSIWVFGCGISVLGMLISLLSEETFVLFVLLSSVVLGFFSIINYFLIINEKSAFTFIQLLKVVIFYIFAFIFAFIESEKGLFFAFLLSIFFSILYGIFKYKIPRFCFEFKRDGFFYETRKSIPFMFSSVLSSGREVIIASFIVFEYGEAAVGLYYISVMYSVKAFVAYGTIQGNKIKYLIYNKGDVKSFLMKILKVGFGGFLAYCFFLMFGVFIGFDAGFDLMMMVALVPITFMYLVLMPLTVFYEIFGFGKSNMIFNFISLLIMFTSCLLAHFFQWEFFYFIFLSSTAWVFVVLSQVIYLKKHMGDLEFLLPPFKSES